MDPEAVHHPVGDKPPIEKITHKKEILLQRPERVLKESSSLQLHGDFDQRHDDRDQREADVCPLLQESLDKLVVDQSQHLIALLPHATQNTETLGKALNPNVESLNKLSCHLGFRIPFVFRYWYFGFFHLSVFIQNPELET
jgi:hypothetical protein